MGTGEPMDNYNNVLRFLELITSEDGLNISQRNITISTCGIVPKIKELAQKHLQITLAISLHSPNDEMRRGLMPIAMKYSIYELLDACHYYFKETNRRMTYTNVKKILADKDAAVIEEYKELVPMFEKMAELAAILRKKRMKRGSIDFDFPETKVVLDEDGHPIDIKPYDRNVATKLIEDFMLIANETVAEDYFWQEIPFVYRTHDKPDSEKIAKLSTFINNFGYTLHIGADEVHPKELQKLLMKVDGTDEESLISRLTLRSMKQARYTTACTGHFGLAANYYCHFTSPIRRYPDLQIHRIIKENIRGRMNDNRREHYESILDAVAKQASETERRAEEAERETVKLKKCEYMSNHIGECFEGVISGVTEWGFFVELPNTVEGLVRVTDLTDDFYEFYEDTYELAGSATNKRYKLGQKIKVVVDSTDKIMRTIDFKPAE